MDFSIWGEEEENVEGELSGGEAVESEEPHSLTPVRTSREKLNIDIPRVNMGEVTRVGSGEEGGAFRTPQKESVGSGNPATPSFINSTPIGHTGFVNFFLDSPSPYTDAAPYSDDTEVRERGYALTSPRPLNYDEDDSSSSVGFDEAPPLGDSTDDVRLDDSDGEAQPSDSPPRIEGESPMYLLPSSKQLQRSLNSTPLKWVAQQDMDAEPKNLSIWAGRGGKMVGGGEESTWGAWLQGVEATEDSGSSSEDDRAAPVVMRPLPRPGLLLTPAALKRELAAESMAPEHHATPIAVKEALVAPALDVLHYATPPSLKKGMAVNIGEENCSTAATIGKALRSDVELPLGQPRDLCVSPADAGARLLASDKPPPTSAGRAEWLQEDAQVIGIWHPGCGRSCSDCNLASPPHWAADEERGGPAQHARHIAERAVEPSAAAALLLEAPACERQHTSGTASRRVMPPTSDVASEIKDYLVGHHMHLMGVSQGNPAMSSAAVSPAARSAAQAASGPSMPECGDSKGNPAGEDVAVEIEEYFKKHRAAVLQGGHDQAQGTPPRASPLALKSPAGASPSAQERAGSPATAAVAAAISAHRARSPGLNPSPSPGQSPDARHTPPDQFRQLELASEKAESLGAGILEQRAGAGEHAAVEESGQADAGGSGEGCNLVKEGHGWVSSTGLRNEEMRSASGAMVGCDDTSSSSGSDDEEMAEEGEQARQDRGGAAAGGALAAVGAPAMSASLSGVRTGDANTRDGTAVDSDDEGGGHVRSAFDTAHWDCTVTAAPRDLASSSRVPVQPREERKDGIGRKCGNEERRLRAVDLRPRRRPVLQRVHQERSLERVLAWRARLGALRRLWGAKARRRGRTLRRSPGLPEEGSGQCRRNVTQHGLLQALRQFPEVARRQRHWVWGKSTQAVPCQTEVSIAPKEASGDVAAIQRGRAQRSEHTGGLKQRWLAGSLTLQLGQQ
eukprot:gene8572-10177_t